ncbi:hypothetical protein [Jatrophihabitans sp.]|uniref:hypothetical protein n=1 Tax=Jatrophihabitans sp. TaxID=1932789 RepID=UPI0030C6B9AD|nr:hypothetical protein [Jatrophihabitans sp.]
MTGPYLSGLVTDPGSLVQQIAARTSKHTIAVTQIGQITDITAGVITVNIGGAVQTAVLTLAPVDVGDNVLVLQQNTQDGSLLYVLGPLATLTPPLQGTVDTLPTDSYTIPVVTDAGTVNAWWSADYTPTEGDAVILTWLGSQPFVLGAQGILGTPPAPTPKLPPNTPPPPTPDPIAGTTTFPASDCGTWQGGWRTDVNGNVIQGPQPDDTSRVDVGAWFYSGRVASTLEGATVVGAQIWLGRVGGGDDGAQTVTLYRTTDDVVPAGNVTFTATEATASLAVGDSGWYPLPPEFVQELVDSGGSIGVQAAAGPYVRLEGLNQSGNAGALRITWSNGG